MVCSSEIPFSSDLDPTNIYCVYSETGECCFGGLVLGFCLFFHCAIEESPGWSQETWVLTMFKTICESHLLGDASQTS